jgi:hypothetical protein
MNKGRIKRDRKNRKLDDEFLNAISILGSEKYFILLCAICGDLGTYIRCGVSGGSQSPPISHRFRQRRAND